MKNERQLELKFDDPVEYLTISTYRHAPLQAGYHEIPIRGLEVAVVVNTGSHGPFLQITVGRWRA